MAKVIPGLNFTGSIDMLSFYKMRGHDEIIMRRKGGPSKEQIRKLPSFEKTRRLNSEFGGRSAAVQMINQAMLPLKSLADYTYIGKLNSILKPIQELDTTNEFGKRSVNISRNPSVLNGFSLNRNNNFEHFVRIPPDISVSKEDFSARISIPALRYGLNLSSPYKHPVFAFIISLGTVHDFDHWDTGYNPNTIDELRKPQWKQTEWFPVKAGSPALTLELHDPVPTNYGSLTMIVSIGICFGNLAANGEFEQVKYAGAAKILLAK